jgi:hypothetical protein
MLQAISLNTKLELLQDDEVVLSRLEQAENDCLGLEHTDTSALQIWSPHWSAKAKATYEKAVKIYN